MTWCLVYRGMLVNSAKTMAFEGPRQLRNVSTMAFFSFPDLEEQSRPILRCDGHSLRIRTWRPWQQGEMLLLAIQNVTEMPILGLVPIPGSSLPTRYLVRAVGALAMSQVTTMNNG